MKEAHIPCQYFQISLLFFFLSTALCFITALFLSFQLFAIKIASSLTLVCAMLFSFSLQLYSCKDRNIVASWGGKKSHEATVLSLFGTREWFCGRQFFAVTGGGKWFWDDSSILHLLCTVFLLLLHHLHLRSVGIRSWRLRNPATQKSV